MTKFEKENLHLAQDIHQQGECKSGNADCEDWSSSSRCALFLLHPRVDQHYRYYINILTYFVEGLSNLFQIGCIAQASSVQFLGAFFLLLSFHSVQVYLLLSKRFISGDNAFKIIYYLSFWSQLEASSSIGFSVSTSEFCARPANFRVSIQITARLFYASTYWNEFCWQQRCEDVASGQQWTS